jgi:hypothetical protein
MYACGFLNSGSWSRVLNMLGLSRVHGMLDVRLFFDMASWCGPRDCVDVFLSGHMRRGRSFLRARLRRRLFCVWVSSTFVAMRISLTFCLRRSGAFVTVFALGASCRGCAEY